jgi:Flp pilus assembly protein TadD
VSRDNVLFTLGGVLVGFILAYTMFEAMSTRQPALRTPDPAAAAAAAAMPGGPGAAPGGATSPGAQQSFEQVQRLRQYVADNPEDADAVLTLANLNFEIRNWTGSRDLYLRYLALRPGDPDVMTDLGVSYRNLGEPQQALQQFRQARADNADHWISLFNEVVVLAFDLADYPAAEQQMAELRRLQPSNPDVDRLAAEIERRREAAS